MTLQKEFEAALKSGNLDQANRYFKQGSINPFSVDELNRNLLYWAAYRGEIGSALFLIRHAGNSLKLINQVDCLGYSSLTVAVANKDKAMAALLIENGADLQYVLSAKKDLAAVKKMKTAVEVAEFLINHPSKAPKKRSIFQKKENPLKM